MATFDADAFNAAVEATRKARGLTRRQAATEAGISPSTLTRLDQGKSVDMANFAALVGWLGVGADTFINRAASEAVRTAEPLAAAVLVLREDPRVSPHAADVIERVLATVYEALTEDKEES